MDDVKRVARRARVARAVALGIMAGGVAAAGIFGLRSLRGPRAPDAARQGVERAATPRGMVYVPGGDFRRGTDDPDADEDVRPQRRVFVPSFYMDRTEVTNREYQRFKPDYVYPAGEDDLPVTGVLYDEAASYAQWAGKRLPTEAEWEKAARGTDGRRYPWGNDWDPARVASRAGKRGVAVATAEIQQKSPGLCMLGPSRVRPVGSAPGSVSPYGCLDMAGNAWEWVQGFYNGNPDQRILRGGAVGYGERACRTYTRGIEGAGST